MNNNEFYEQLDNFKELLFEDIKKITIKFNKFDDFSNYIKQEINLKEYLLKCYKNHLSIFIDEDILLSQDTNLKKIITEFDLEINEFLDQIQNNDFDGFFEEVTIKKTQIKINNMFD